MSVHYPRRVKDLPTLDFDEEEEPNTPQKKKERSNTSKSMHGFQSKENQTADTNQRMFPKRSSELPSLDSDSEIDESFKNDHLNCAILNDSFLLSPLKNELNEVAAETPAGKLLRKNAATAEANELSFLMNFNKLDLSANQEDTPEPSKQHYKSTCSNQGISKHNLCCPTLESIDENAQPVDSNVNDQNQNTSLKRKVIDTPYNSAINPKTTGTATKATSSANESQFATPQIRSFSMQKRPRELCSTQSQKSRNAMVNEFRSQKVLFQTPIALSRVPLACLPNDSVTLSLCDTINESGNTPNTVEKSPPKDIKTESSGKSKKSLESEFSTTDQSSEKENAEMPSVVSNKAAPTLSALESTESNSTNQSKPSSKTSIKINTVEYTIVRKLGSGGSSLVYQALRKHDQKDCALKVVDLRGDPSLVEGYMNETKLLAKLQGNPCVVSLYDYELLQKESKLFMVMEKGDSDLQKILQGYTTNLPLYVLMSYLYQMLQAVNYIHQNGVIHSDLKPANFLMAQGRLKLIDFGIASNIAIDSTSIIKFSQAGTFNYISPEALTDTSSGTSPIRHNHPKIKISTRSDVWSLGCILYLFLYKKTPFSHIKNIYAKINAISSPKTIIEFPGIPAYYPIMLVHMVKNCLQHNPKQRPSCAELLQYPFHMIIPVSNLAAQQQVSKPLQL